MSFPKDMTFPKVESEILCDTWYNSVSNVNLGSLPIYCLNTYNDNQDF